MIDHGAILNNGANITAVEAVQLIVPKACFAEVVKHPDFPPKFIADLFDVLRDSWSVPEGEANQFHLILGVDDFIVSHRHTRLGGAAIPW